MRIRLIKNVRMAGASSVELLAGSVVNTTPEIASEWIKQGVAMEDKLLEEPSETKEVPPLYVSEKDKKLKAKAKK